MLNALQVQNTIQSTRDTECVQKSAYDMRVVLFLNKKVNLSHSVCFSLLSFPPPYFKRVALLLEVQEAGSGDVWPQVRMNRNRM